MDTKKDISKLPDSELPAPKEDFRETFQWKIFRVMAEFIDGFHFVADLKKAVTIFGSTQLKEDNEDYQKAKKLGFLLAKDGFSVVTGGGPGIMEAANRGAFEAKGDSVGINIQLLEGERANAFLSRSIAFHYFFTRKVMLSYSSYGYVFFAGGFGTLDEFFEIITLIHTKRISNKTLVIAVGKKYWQVVYDLLEKSLVKEYKTIFAKDLDLFYIVDTPEEAFEIIQANYNKKINNK